MPSLAYRHWLPLSSRVATLSLVMSSSINIKRSLKHPGPKIWNNIDPSLHDSSPLTFRNSAEIYLSLHMMTDSMVLKHGVIYVICNPHHLNCSPLLFKLHIPHWTYSLLPWLSSFHIFLTLLYILPFFTAVVLKPFGSWATFVFQQPVAGHKN